MTKRSLSLSDRAPHRGVQTRPNRPSIIERIGPWILLSLVALSIKLLANDRLLFAQLHGQWRNVSTSGAATRSPWLKWGINSAFTRSKNAKLLSVQHS